MLSRFPWMALLLALLLLIPPVPRPAAAAPNCDPGQFLYKVWQGTDTSTLPVYTGCATLPRADWGAAYPTGVTAVPFTVEWTGIITNPAASYAIAASSDDGLQVKIAGEALTNDPGVNTWGGASVAATRWLSGSTEVVVTYQRTRTVSGSNPSLGFSYRVVDSGGTPDSCPVGYLSRYTFSDGRFAFSRCSTAPSVNWTGGLNPDLGPGWKVTFTGTERFKRGDYLFNVSGGGRVTLSAGSATLLNDVDSAAAGFTQPAAVTLSGNLPVTFNYTAGSTPGVAGVTWSRASCPAEQWAASYYDSAGNLVLRTCEAQPDYDFTQASPAAWAGGTVPASYTIVWTAPLAFGQGQYQFEVEATGTNRTTLSVGGEVLLPSGVGTRRAGRTYSTSEQTVTLTYEASVAGKISLRRTRAPQPDPEAARRCPAGTYLAEYTVTGRTAPSLATCDTRQADWGLGAPESWVGAVPFAVRFSSEIDLLPGTYTFRSAGGVQPDSVTLNGVTVFAGTAGAQALLDGGPYRLTAAYTPPAGGGRQSVSLDWDWIPPASHDSASDPVHATYSGAALTAAGLTSLQLSGAAFPAVFGEPDRPAAWVDGPGYTLTVTGSTWFAPAVADSDGDLAVRFFGFAPAGVYLLVNAEDAVQATGRYLGEGYRLLQEGRAYTVTLAYAAEGSRPLPRVWWESDNRPRLTAATVASDRGATAPAGNRVHLTFDRPLRGAAFESDAGFDVFFPDGSFTGVTGLTVSGQTAQLTLGREIAEGEAAWLMYSPRYPVPTLQALPAESPILFPLGLHATATGGAGAGMQGPVGGVRLLGGAPAAEPRLLGSTPLDIVLDGAQAVGRLEVVAGSVGTSPTGQITVSVPSDGSTWQPAASLSVTGLTTGQTAAATFSPTVTRRLRITYTGSPDLPVAALRLFGSPAELPVPWLPATVLAYTREEISIRSARLSGKILEIEYDRLLDPGSVPSPATGTDPYPQFVVTADVSPPKVESVQVVGSRVRLYLNRDLGFTVYSVAVEYSRSGTPVLRDINHRPLPTAIVPVAALGLEDIGNASLSSLYDDFNSLTDDRILYGAANGKDNSVTTAFQTRPQPGPWWQLALAYPSRLETLKLENVAGEAGAGARYLVVALSADGETWTDVYTHSGPVFGTGAQALTVNLGGRTARFIRLEARWPAGQVGSFSLAEVRLSGSPILPTGP